jgi:hypothetical protein
MPPRAKKQKCNQPRHQPMPVVTREVQYCNRNEIVEALLCSICTEVFTHPRRINCGHTFCKVCIETWFSTSRQYKCPSCRADIFNQATHDDLLAKEFLNREEVFCNFAGCIWVGKLENLDNHMSECDCDPTKVPDSPLNRVTNSSLRLRLYNNEMSGRSVKAVSPKSAHNHNQPNQESVNIDELVDIYSDDELLSFI